MRSPTTAAFLTILNALLWAGAMIAVAEMVPDRSGATGNWLIAGWFLTHGLIIAGATDGQRAGAEWRCLKARLRRILPGRG